MVWTLCRTFVVCVRRRVVDAAASAPLVAAGVLAMLAAVPALSLWSGLRAAEALRPVLVTRPEVARGAATALALAAALAGVLVVSVAPGRRALGRQLEPAPVSPAASTAALTLAPVAALLVAAALPAALFLAPVAGGATPAALAALAACVAAGALAAEVIVAIARRALPWAAAMVAILAIALTDPVGVLARALGGETSLRALPVAAGALAAWAACAARRPDPRATRGIVYVRSRGIFSAAFARCARQRQLRAHAVAAVAFGGAGTAALRGSGFDSNAAATVASLTAIVGAATIPLAAPGLHARAAWFWRSAPVRASSLFVQAAAAALAAAAAVAGAGTAAALLVAPADARLLATAAAAAAVLFGCAVLAGTAVPWGNGSAGDQLASLAAFGAAAGCWSFVLGRLAAVAGVEEGGGAAVLAAGSLVLSVAVAVTIDAKNAR